MIGLVSIMMPAYNADRYIGQAIESVISQTYTNWELILVNDGSTDHTEQVVGRYTDPRIKLISQMNSGEATARNTALDCMQGEFVAFLDADDLFLEHHLENMVRFLQEHPNLDGVYTDGHYCHPDGTVIRSLSSQRRGPFQGWIFEQLVRASDVFGPPICVLLRRALIEQHALRFDPRITIGPDWDFLTRFSEYAQFGYLEEHTCLYRVHQTNVTVRTNRMKRAESLAICREKAIKLTSFRKCSLETRSYAFFDLLINLLDGRIDRQQLVIQWPEFVDLPSREQSRLLRIMASRAISNDMGQGEIKHWLDRSRELSPSDFRSMVLSFLYQFNPAVCTWIVRQKRTKEKKPNNASPFGELL